VEAPVADLDLCLLRSFLSLADELSFTRAARRLFVSQPSLSSQIRRLEQQVGTPLFERTSRRVRLTTAGMAFYPGAIRILESVEQAIAVVQIPGATDQGGLRLGHALGGADLIGPLGALLAREHGAGAVPQPLDFADQLGAPARSRVDAAFVYPPYASRDLAGLQLLPVRVEQRVAVLPAAHRLARRDVVHPRDLVDEAFVGLDPATPWVWRSFWLLRRERAAGRGTDPEPGPAARNAAELLSLVASTGGVATAPASFPVANAHPEVAYRPLVGAAPATLALAWPASSGTPLLEPLIEALRHQPPAATPWCVPEKSRAV
jgi:DNA-binding transcriptional LysR family regulator